MRSRIAFAGILFAIMLILPSVFALEGNTDPREGNIDTSISNDVISLYSQSKALFIENKGQWDPSILYLTIIPSGFIALANDGIYHLHIITDEPKGNPLAKERIQSTSLVKILFKECSPAIIIGNGLDSSYYNFYLGNNSKKWATGVRGYHSVIYENVWD
ncbi:MAG: hypothetical protein QCI82_11455, partial [Candidatus Thermoplasmatota archaeon]|nr:hypothetical protein [Candidatus Thermoplasmatota archaeon]